MNKVLLFSFCLVELCVLFMSVDCGGGFNSDPSVEDQFKDAAVLTLLNNDTFTNKIKDRGNRMKGRIVDEAVAAAEDTQDLSSDMSTKLRKELIQSVEAVTDGNDPRSVAEAVAGTVSQNFKDAKYSRSLKYAGELGGEFADKFIENLS